jgi:galactokinase
MGASHESLRDDFEVSCEELDLVVAAARELGEARGIYGCRMTGGGFGGCCVALVRTAQAAEAAQALAEAYRAASGIDPVLFITRPADGPQVLRAP